MALLGLGILLATLSFFCYKNPTTSSSFLRWLGGLTAGRASQICAADSEVVEGKVDVSRPEDEVIGRVDDNRDGPIEAVGGGTVQAAEVQNQTKAVIEEATRQIKAGGLARDEGVEATKAPLISNKVLDDRKAMPPPSLSLSKPTTSAKSPSSPRTPKAIPAPTTAVPSFDLDSFEASPEPPIMFPAANSAQRASGPSSRSSSQISPYPVAPPPLRSAMASSSMMAPPTRSPLPNRGPPGRTPAQKSSLLPPAAQSSGGLAPPPTHSAIPTKPRKKVQLTPGHSPLDWANLSRDPTINLNGLPPNTSYLKVPPSLLKIMNGRRDKATGERKDAWTVLSGKVYNITPYAPYHPGGDGELMRCAGKDGTKMFGEVHPWVNWEGMLEGCLVGVAVGEREVMPQPTSVTGGGGSLDDMD